MKTTLPECRYNHMVNCSAQGPCEKCGWNPEVAEARKKQIEDGGAHALTKEAK